MSDADTPNANTADAHTLDALFAVIESRRGADPEPARPPGLSAESRRR